MLYRVKAVLVFWARLGYLILVAPLTLALARSWRGWVEGLFGAVLNVLVGSGLAALLYLAAGVDPPTILGVTAAIGGVGLLAAGVASSLIPQVRTCHLGRGPMTSHFFGRTPDPTAVGWADTEDEHAANFVWLVTRLDWRMSDEEAAAAREAISELADETRTHPDYHRLARGSDLAGRRLMVGRLDPRHCYLYRPPDEPLGLLVFLHGHGGNHLLAVHALRPLADALGLAVVAPTFGYGNWEAPGGVEAVRRARDYALKALPIDPARVYLAGLSQGGAGVGRAAAADPHAYAGLVFLSATMVLDVLGSEVFAATWGRKPVLVIQGEQDRNVPPESVAEGADVLRANGATVTVRLDPEAGHFLYFTKRDEVQRDVGEWVRNNETGRGSRG